MPKAYGYIRVSTHEQVQHGYSLASQKSKIQGYYSALLKSDGYEWGGIISEEGVSGKKRFLARKAGRHLANKVEGGDVIVFVRVDRGWRDTEDMLRTIRLFKQRKITVRFLDVSLDTGTAIGEAVLTILGAMAKMERALIGQRTKEGLQAIKDKGQPQKAPMGWRRHGKGKDRKILPCDYTRKHMKELVRLVEEEKKTIDRIYFEWGVLRIRDRRSKEYTMGALQRAIQMYRIWRDQGDVDPRKYNHEKHRQPARPPRTIYA